MWLGSRLIGDRDKMMVMLNEEDEEDEDDAVFHSQYSCRAPSGDMRVWSIYLWLFSKLHINLHILYRVFCCDSFEKHKIKYITLKNFGFCSGLPTGDQLVTSFQRRTECIKETKKRALVL